MVRKTTQVFTCSRWKHFNLCCVCVCSVLQEKLFAGGVESENCFSAFLPEKFGPKVVGVGHNLNYMQGSSLSSVFCPASPLAGLLLLFGQLLDKRLIAGRGPNVPSSRMPDFGWPRTVCYVAVMGPGTGVREHRKCVEQFQPDVKCQGACRRCCHSGHGPWSLLFFLFLWNLQFISDSRCQAQHEIDARSDRIAGPRSGNSNESASGCY